MHNFIPGAPRDTWAGVTFDIFGGGEKKGGTTTQVQNSDPWAPQQPYIKNQFKRAEDLYSGGDLAPAYYSGNTVADQANETQQALNIQARRALEGSPLNASAQQSMQQTLNGDFLSSGNPYMSQMMDKVSAEVMPRIDAKFAHSGRYGSGSHMDAASSALADAASEMAFNNYVNERGRMMQGAAMAPKLAATDYQDITALGEVGTARENFNQQKINADVDRYNYESRRPMEALGQYTGLIGGSYGGQSTNTGSQTYRTNPFGSALGGAMAGGSMFGGAGAIGGGILGLLGGL